MIRKIIKDINLREYFPSPLWCFFFENLNCNDDCLACLGYLSLTSRHETDKMRMNVVCFIILCTVWCSEVLVVALLCALPCTKWNRLRECKCWKKFRYNYTGILIHKNDLIDIDIKKHWHSSDVFIVNFEKITHLFLFFHCWIRVSVASCIYQRRSK